MFSPLSCCRAAIRRAGALVSLERGERRIPLLASIQPRGREDPKGGPLGLGGHTLATLYAPAGDPAPQEGDRVVCQSGRYRVEGVETHLLRGEPLYYRAALREWGEWEGGGDEQNP